MHEDVARRSAIAPGAPGKRTLTDLQGHEPAPSDGDPGRAAIGAEAAPAALDRGRDQGRSDADRHTVLGLFGHAGVAGGAPAQAKFDTAERRDDPAAVSELRAPAPGGAPLPPDLRHRLETRSRIALGDVRVHHDSDRPARIGARAYAQGRDIYLGPGQDEHLAHEAWHVVQQRQGRVAATTAIAGLPANTDPALEAEADAAAVSGETAEAGQGMATPPSATSHGASSPVIQGRMTLAPNGAFIDDETGISYREADRTQTRLTVRRADGVTVVVDLRTMQPIETPRQAQQRRSRLAGPARALNKDHLFAYLVDGGRSLDERQRMILAHQADRALLGTVRDDIYRYRQSHLNRHAELLAVVKYLREVEHADGEPQNTLTWVHEMVVRYEDGEVEAWLAAGKRISDLSALTILQLVRDRLSRPDGDGGPRTAKVDSYLVAFRAEVIGLCDRAPFHTVALAVSLLGEVVKEAAVPAGRSWAELGIIACADRLRARYGDPRFSWSGIDTWDVMKLATGLAPMARRDPGVDHLLELLAPHVNQGLAGGVEMQRERVYYDRFLVGTLAAYGQLGHRTVEDHRMFEQAAPYLVEMAGSLGQPLTAGSAQQSTGIHVRTGPVRLTPEHLAEALWAYGKMVGRTDFDNLSPDIQAAIKQLAGAALLCLPTRQPRIDRSTVRFNRDQLVQLTSAVLLFRNPPKELQTLLAQSRAATEDALTHGTAPTEILDGFLYAMGVARGDVGDLGPLYLAAVRQLVGHVAKYTQPGVELIALTVTAYEGKGALGELAEWYELQAEADPRAPRTGDRPVNPRATAQQLRDTQTEAAALLDQALGTLLDHVRAALPQYSMIRRRRVLHELTRLRSLPAARLPSELDELERTEDGVLTSEQQRAEQVADVFTDVSASPELRGDPSGMPPVRQAQALADHAWLGTPRPSDRAWIDELIAQLTRSAAAAAPAELARVVATLGRIRRPDQPVQAFLDQLVVIVAGRIADQLDTLDAKFYADVLGGLRELPSPVVVRFVELMEAVVQAQLRRPDDQARFANLLRILGTYVQLEDRELSDDREPGAGVAVLRHQVITALRARLAVNYGNQREDERVYDREKARSSRQTLPWRGYDRHLRETYPPGKTLDREVASARDASEDHFGSLGSARGTVTTDDNLYTVFTVSPEGDVLRSQTMDNVIFRELTRNRFDFVFVELPARAHLDRFKGMVAFRGKNYRYDVYGGSKLKAQTKPDKTKASAIQAIGMEEGAVAFFESLFNFQEGFFYAQRALFPNNDKPTVGLKGDLSVRVYPDELPAFRFGDLPFRTYDGWGFIKGSVAARMEATRPRHDRDRPPERGGNMPTQAYQWYPEDQAAIDEAVTQGKADLAGRRSTATGAPRTRAGNATSTPSTRPARGGQTSSDSALDAEVDALYRALTTGRPPMRNAVAVPVEDNHVVLPAQSPLYQGASQGLLLGRTPYDNPNLKPVPGERVRYREPGNTQPDAALAASDFLAKMESIQYTLTGYSKPVGPVTSAGDDAVGGLAFFKGMLGIVPDAHWPKELASVDVALSNSDVKLDEAWQGADQKPKIEAVTDLLVQGMLVVKQWHTADYHIGVPTKTQKWLAGDYDGDLDAIMFRDRNPALYDMVDANFQEQGVSSKLDKTFTPSGEVRTRSKQIQDVMSPVLGMWSTLSDRINALPPDRRAELSAALVPGMVLEVSDAQMASLLVQTPARLAALHVRLDQRDAVIATDPAAWLAGANPVSRRVAAHRVDADTDEDLVAALSTADRTHLIGELRALHPLTAPEDIQGWLALASADERAVVREVLAVELISLELQMGIKIGTDAFKTKSQAPRYFERGRQYLHTAAAMKIGDQPVPYGKGLLRKLPELGAPDLTVPAWRELYARCTRAYGIPARVMQRMIVELSPPVDMAALENEAAAWVAENEVDDGGDAEGATPPAPDRTPELLDQLDEIFRTRIYPYVNQGGQTPELPPRTTEASLQRPPAYDATRTDAGDHQQEPEPASGNAAAPGGIVNAGNTCYLASVLQLIAATPRYRRALAGVQLDGQAATLRDRCLAIIAELDTGRTVDRGRVVALEDALVAIGWLHEHERGLQHDAAELLTVLLDRMQANSGLTVRRERRFPYDAGHRDQDEHMLTVGGLHTAPVDRNRSMSDIIHDGRDEVEYGDNGELREAHSERFRTIPDTLTINLNRHGYSRFLERPFRRQELVHDPLHLNLGADLTPDGEARTYHLTACVVHIAPGDGSTAGAGHYVTYVHRNGAWWRCDDTRVTPVAPAAVRQAVALGYVFVYQRDGVEDPIQPLADQQIEPGLDAGEPVHDDNANEDDVRREAGEHGDPAAPGTSEAAKAKRKRRKRNTGPASESAVTSPPVVDQLAALATEPIQNGDAASALLTRAARLTGPVRSAGELATRAARAVFQRLWLRSKLPRGKLTVSAVQGEIRALATGLAALDASHPGAAQAAFDALLAMAADKTAAPEMRASYAELLLALLDAMGRDSRAMKTQLTRLGFGGL